MSKLSSDNRKTLLKIARDSIQSGLEKHCALQLSLNELPPILQTSAASFVTLKLQGRLRGCIGHLEAIQALALDVAENAYHSAFDDPRFQAVSAQEFLKLDIQISVLSPSSPMSFSSEEDLLSQIRPGVDGLILVEGFKKSTFLPSVWEEIEESREFLTHLKVKAGLAPTYWSESLKISRYSVDYIERE